MTDLEIRKRELLARSEIYRQALSAEMVRLQRATTWIARGFQIARMVSPLLAVAVPAAGWALRGRKKPVPPKRKGLLAKAIAGYQIVRQIKPIWEGLQRARP